MPSDPLTPDILPNLLIIGAGKSGTTTLWRLLGRHPDIWMSPEKEPNFFNKPEHFQKQRAGYARLMRPGRKKRYRGEASNNYSCLALFPATIPNMRSALGREKIKFIYITRDPLERAASEWMESRRDDSGKPDLPFDQFIRTDAYCLEKSYYRRQYEAYAENFGAGNILCLFFEDLKRDPRDLLRQVWHFLDLPEPGDLNALTNQRERRASGQFETDAGWLRRLKQILPGYQSLKNLIPLSWREGLRPFLKKAHRVERPQWDPATRKWFLDQIEAEAREYLRERGKPSDFWQF